MEREHRPSDGEGGGHTIDGNHDEVMAALSFDNKRAQPASGMDLSDGQAVLKLVRFDVSARNAMLGPVVELADTQDLGSCAERCAGSSPARAISAVTPP